MFLFKLISALVITATLGLSFINWLDGSKTDALWLMGLGIVYLQVYSINFRGIK